MLKYFFVAGWVGRRRETALPLFTRDTTFTGDTTDPPALGLVLKILLVLLMGILGNG